MFAERRTQSVLVGAHRLNCRRDTVGRWAGQLDLAARLNSDSAAACSSSLPNRGQQPRPGDSLLHVRRVDEVPLDLEACGADHRVGESAVVGQLKCRCHRKWLHGIGYGAKGHHHNADRDTGGGRRVFADRLIAALTAARAAGRWPSGPLRWRS